MQPKKIRVADIERLQRTIENVPEHRMEEVTTAQAVRILSSSIHAMQAKGYGLAAIAGLLSDNGLAVTPATLKTYLSEARTGKGRKTRRKSKSHRADGVAFGPTASTTESTAAVAALPDSGDAPPAVREVAASASAAMPPTATASPALAPKSTARPSDDASRRRSAFVPKEDTRDI